MKTRILSAVVLVPVLLVVVLAAPKALTAILVGVMCAVAAYELLHGTGLVRHPRLVVYTMVMGFLVPIWCHFGMERIWAQVGILAFFCLLFLEVLLSQGKLPFAWVSICIVGGLLLPYLLSSIVRILDGEDGRYFVLAPFVAAFMSDSGAYFAGKFLGKHKLAPVISPNKTTEGVVGGLLSAILFMVVYGLVLGLGFQLRVNYLCAALYGLLGAMAGVFGDLCFSAIKRQTHIKDYGKLIPGHGGILDRFDSVMVVAPMIEILLNLLPMAVRE